MEINNILFWVTIGFMSVLIIGLSYLYVMEWLKKKKDIIFMIDKNNRWSLHYVDIRGLPNVELNNQKYLLSEDTALLNYNGKSLHVFGENNPIGLKLSYKKPDWLDSRSIMSIINNELVRQIVTPKDSLKDMIMMFGAIGGAIAGIGTVILLLIQTGVITL